MPFGEQDCNCSPNSISVRCSRTSHTPDRNILAVPFLFCLAPASGEERGRKTALSRDYLGEETPRALTLYGAALSQAVVLPETGMAQISSSLSRSKNRGNVLWSENKLFFFFFFFFLGSSAMFAPARMTTSYWFARVHMPTRAWLNIKIRLRFVCRRGSNVTEILVR